MDSKKISAERLAELGERTARELSPSRSGSGRRAAQELMRRIGLLRRFAGLAERTLREEGAYRWLADNRYLAEREGAEAYAAFRRAGSLRADGRGIVVLSAARAMLDADISAAEDCAAFLTGFQRRLILERRELLLLPAALRCEAIRALAELYREKAPSARRAAFLFNALRQWSRTDFAPVLERCDRVEQLLLRDPAGVYPGMDEESRAAYRREVERLAKKRGIPEYRAAERVLRLSRSAASQNERHVGWWLYRAPLGDKARSLHGGGYIAFCILLPTAFALALGIGFGNAAAALLVWLPLSELVKNLLDTFLLRRTPPRRLPRMELRSGVPAEGRTVVAVSVLLTGEEAADGAAQRLEEFRLANRDAGENLLFALLADLPECDSPEDPGDEALLLAARRTIDALNGRRGGGFCLLTRERSFNRDTGRYAPFERKRGAIMELAKLLCGKDSSLHCLSGDTSVLRGARFILALDADTRLTPGSARAMIGTMLHPLCRPVVSARRHIVTAGHGILHPRIATELSDSVRNDFARLFAPQGGTDPYLGCAGELYMDLFASGGFAGKGLIDAEALLLCMSGRIPNGRVLSHDALEGAFLRGGLIEDCELSDGFPASPLSYYRRAHRWVRGDWQNLPWLFSRGRDLPPIERWRLFDSLRRSLVSVGVLVCFAAAMLIPTRAFLYAAAAALLSLLFHLLLTLCISAMRTEEEVRVRMLSPLLHGGAGAFTRLLAQLWLLPTEAWTDLSAVLTALWRMTVTKRGLLEWQTAAQSDQAKTGLSAILRRDWPVTVFSLALLFSPTVLGKAAGCVWLLSPFFLAALSRTEPARSALSSEDRAWLTQRAGEIWHWFETCCTESEHYLPPDNLQEQPPVGIAHRTSPTNIGLAMLSALSAVDLGLCSRQTAVTLLAHQLDTLESLPKWNGHLYNWYDTRTLLPLRPGYISTVDSGNLAGCLLVLRQGLTEYGCRRLAARAQALEAAMDFAALYDFERNLFRIGLTPGDESDDLSRYDLLESEERLTAFLAIASGQVPLRHWKRLSRAQLGCNGFRGCASWSGTMFEYLMPELFLPLIPGSLLGESARYCLYVQRRQRFGRLGVWGKSESAFHSLDPAMNYRYKAHGCSALALSRGMDTERVAAPYASFLALAVAPRAAVQNLRRFETLGALGPWGFWEAVDFTPQRGGDADGLIVRCVMAHHLGMSLAAITNSLTGGVHIRRFLSDPSMAAYRSLLAEKIPLGGVLLHRREITVPEKARPRAEAGGVRLGDGVCWSLPSAQPLSNGVYHLLLTESGLSRSEWNGLRPYRAPDDPFDTAAMRLFLRCGGETVSLLPERSEESAFRRAFSAGKAALCGSGHGISWSMEVTVPSVTAGERREVHIRGLSAEAELFWCFEPSLVPERDYRAQPAFARLGLTAETVGDALLITRLPRSDRPEQYMAVACSQECFFSSDYTRFPTRSGSVPFESGSGSGSAPFVTVRVPLHVSEAEQNVCLALTVSDGREEALRGARRALRESEGAAMGEAAARLLNMDPAAHEAALAMLPALIFPHVSAAAETEEAVRVEELWRCGISGDYPIVSLEQHRTQSVTAAVEQLRRHALLGAQGVHYDLVLLMEEDGDYARPQRTAMEELLTRLGREALLGAPGGVHFLPLAEKDTIRAASALFCQGSGSEALTVPAEHPLPPAVRTAVNEGIEFAWDGEDSAVLRCRGGVPPRQWIHLLTNGSLSALVSESGPGGVWFRNARECPLTVRAADLYAEEGTETWEAVTPQGVFSLFAAPDGIPCTVRWHFGAASFEKALPGGTVRVTLWIPPDGQSRRLVIESENELRVRWCAPLQLSPEERDRPGCVVSRNGDRHFSAHNIRCAFFGLTFSAHCSVPFERSATSRSAWLAGREDAPLRCGDPCFAAEFTVRRHAELTLTAGESEGTASLQETLRYWRARVARLSVSSPDEELNRLLGGWVPYQILVGRILARSTLCQSGGAIGFRDQIQDYVNFIPYDAGACREHLLICCAHQYREGDVQHWWHPGENTSDRGLRSKCSDDLLWLVWAVSEYIMSTYDRSLLDEEAPYLLSEPLSDTERSRYETPSVSQERESVLAHCRRALTLVRGRGVGDHGLPLMLGGDWNDGLDAMGSGAESVWLAWFYADVCRRFADLTGSETERALWMEEAEHIEESAKKAWLHDHFARAFFGDGEPLGGELFVDAMAQAWAAFSPAVDEKTADAALDTAMRVLYDDEHHILKLCAPPFLPSDRRAGYIASYGAGYRENGGQYTHAALFLARAMFFRGRTEDGYRLLRCAMPSGHGALYDGEPYSIPADIASAPDRPGSSGWTWYTGAAGVFLRAAEDMLGIRFRGGVPDPSFAPQLPEVLDGTLALWRDENGAEMQIGPKTGEKFTKQPFSSDNKRDII